MFRSQTLASADNGSELWIQVTPFADPSADRAEGPPDAAASVRCRCFRGCASRSVVQRLLGHAAPVNPALELEPPTVGSFDFFHAQDEARRVQLFQFDCVLRDAPAGQRMLGAPAALISAFVFRRMVFAMTPNDAHSLPSPGSVPERTEAASNGSTRATRLTYLHSMFQAACLLGSLAVWALSGYAAAAGEPVTIDKCEYGDDSAARAAWKPMGGSAVVSVALLEGRKVLRLPCNFAATKIERASWDQQLKVDLTSSRGIQFNVLCRNASPVSYFSIYFQSGEGWYHALFFPESATGWHAVSIDKTEMTTEGRPAGWGQIRAVRISAWRGKDEDTEFYLSDIRKTGVLGGDAVVAILRSESASKQSPDEGRNVEQFTQAVAQNLYALGIGCAVISDLDVTPDNLKQAKLIILPYNPSVPDRVADELAQYVSAGGKLLVFYAVPERLRPVLKLEGGTHTKAAHPGQFAAIHFGDDALKGAPPVVG